MISYTFLYCAHCSNFMSSVNILNWQTTFAVNSCQGHLKRFCWRARSSVLWYSLLFPPFFPQHRLPTMPVLLLILHQFIQFMQSCVARSCIGLGSLQCFLLFLTLLTPIPSPFSHSSHPYTSTTLKTHSPRANDTFYAFLKNNTEWVKSKVLIVTHSFIMAQLDTWNNPHLQRQPSASCNTNMRAGPHHTVSTYLNIGIHAPIVRYGAHFSCTVTCAWCNNQHHSQSL